MEQQAGDRSHRQAVAQGRARLQENMEQYLVDRGRLLALVHRAKDVEA